MVQCEGVWGSGGMLKCHECERVIDAIFSTTLLGVLRCTCIIQVEVVAQPRVRGLNTSIYRASVLGF